MQVFMVGLLETSNSNKDSGNIIGVSWDENTIQ